MEIFDWNTDANLNQFDPPDGAPENQTILRQLNDIHREFQAVVARFERDTQGALVATGTGGNYDIEPSRQGITSYFEGLTFRVKANHASPSGGSNLQVSYSGVGVGFKPLVLADNTAILENQIPDNSIFQASYNATYDAFVLQSPPAQLPLDEERFRVPVGAVVFLNVATNPATLYGYGVWNKISTGRFVVGEGSHTDSRGEQRTFALGETESGEYQHVVTIPEMPAHTHLVPEGGIASSSTGYRTSAAQWSRGPQITSSAGSGQPHNNTPPYFVLSVWERTA